MALDILIWVVVGAGLIIGFFKGIVGQVGLIVGVVAGIVAARIFGDDVARYFAGGNSPDMVDYVCGYVVVFLGAYFLSSLIARLLRRTARAVHLGIIDRICGALFKAILWTFMLSLVFNLYLIVRGNEHALDSPGKPWRQAVVKFAPATLGYLRHNL